MENNLKSLIDHFQMKEHIFMLKIIKYSQIRVLIRVPPLGLPLSRLSLLKIAAALLITLLNLTRSLILNASINQNTGFVMIKELQK